MREPDEASTYARSVITGSPAYGTRPTYDPDDSDDEPGVPLTDEVLTVLVHHARASWRRRVRSNRGVAAIEAAAMAGDDDALLALVEIARLVKGGAA